jgi:hypothetical protein
MMYSGVGGVHRHRCRRLAAGDFRPPVLEAGAGQVRRAGVPLQHQHRLDPVRRLLEGAADQRHVGNHPVDFDAAGGGQHHLGLGIVHADRQLVGGETAEHHRMHRAQPRAGEHGDGRFRHHRQIDHHAVALAHAQPRQGAGQFRHPVP